MREYPRDTSLAARTPARLGRRLEEPRIEIMQQPLTSARQVKACVKTRIRNILHAIYGHLRSTDVRRGPGDMSTLFRRVDAGNASAHRRSERRFRIFSPET